MTIRTRTALISSAVALACLLGNETNALGGVAVQPDGKVVVAHGALLLRYNTNGSLDRSFSGNGRVRVPSPVSGRPLDAFAVGIQRSGRIVVFGRAIGCGKVRCGGPVAAIAGFRPNGSLDRRFGERGTAGAVPSRGSLGGRVGGFALSAGGKILTAGNRCEDVGLDPCADSVLVRWTANGNRDRGFGTKGAVFPPGSRRTDAIAVDGSGRMITGGREYFSPVSSRPLLSRYLPNGAPDPSFGASGVVEPPLFVVDVDAIADGRVVATGSSSEGLRVVRYLPDGSLDPTFGQGGVADLGAQIFARTGTHLLPSSAGLQNGELTIAGSVPGPRDDLGLGLARLDPSGNLDPSFGDGGVVTTFGKRWKVSSSVDLAVSPRRTVLDDIAQITDPPRTTYLTAAYTHQGSLATAFGGDGLVFNRWDGGVPGPFHRVRAAQIRRSASI